MNNLTPKHILILSANAGFGHGSAAKAVARAIHENYADACKVDIVNPLDNVHTPALLRDSQSDYDALVRRSPELYHWAYDATDSNAPATIIESSVTLMLYDTLKRVLDEYTPDLIILTFPIFLVPLKTIGVLRGKPIPVMMVVTDLTSLHRLWFHPSVDWCCVPTEEARVLAEKQGVEAERIQITGIPVSSAFTTMTQLREALRAQLGWNPTLTTVLVMASRRLSNPLESLHLLNHSALPIQLVVVAGGDDELYHKLTMVEWHLPVHIYNFVDQVPQFMLASDCILTKAGGLTVAESLAAGLPILIQGVIPGQESGNAAYVVDHEAGVLTKTPEQVLEILFHWLQNGHQGLHDHARHARFIGRPNAAYDIAQTAMRMLDSEEKKVLS